MKISCSDIATFQRCRRKWYYCVDGQLRLSPRRQAPALYLGSGVHDALEAFYRDGTPDLVAHFDHWVDQQALKWMADGMVYDTDQLHTQRELGRAMLAGYLQYYGRTPDSDRDGIQVFSTEQQFQLPIPDFPEGILVGRMDGLLRDREDRVWILENKTYSQLPKTLALHLQTLVYTWAANQLCQAGAFAHFGLTPDTRIWGALYNGLRKQLPGPKVKNPLFHREFVMRTMTELTNVGELLSSVYQDMATPNGAFYPAYSWDCVMCDFYQPCHDTLTGGDVEWTLERDFIKQPPRGAVYQQDDE